MKLKESIPSNSVKIIELYNKIDSEILDTSPDFQRKLVWKKQHKYSFIDTILMNYPFPEVYIASSEMDVENLISKEIVVDGKQRLTTIVDYIKGINDFESQNKVKRFDELELDQKRDFLNYLVTVKDLKDMQMDNIKEIFQRINSTEYSLNTIEKTNAQFGDGEFAVFCKQIVDSDYRPTKDDTDIILDVNIKKELNVFFKVNNVFSENDLSRMFDVQYAMLIISSFLEGDYYGRSSKVNEYFEKYNSEFKIYEAPLSYLLNSIRIINQLGFSEFSYWFNKANLFTLIIELGKTKAVELDLQKLETLLLEIETKVDLYFSDDESLNISDDEKKYFEVARQGSHEKASRIHRGKVISKLINDCSKNTKLSNEQKRIQILIDKGVKFATIQPTRTGLEKNIMDATLPLRTFLKENNIHNYESQENGTSNKETKEAKYILDNEIISTQISLYKSNGRGDTRIWLTKLNEVAVANNTIAIIAKNDELFVINISTLEIENLIGNDCQFTTLIISE